MESFLEYVQHNEVNFFSFNKVRALSYAALLTAFGVMLFKYISKWKIYFDNFPMEKSSLKNLFVIIRYFFFSTKMNNLPSSVYVFQFLCGHWQLFKHKMFCCFWFALTPVILIFKAEAVEAVIAGSRNIEKAWVYRWLHPWLGTGLLTSHGSKWKSRRKLLTPAFHFDILKDFLPVFNEQSQLLVSILRKEVEEPWTEIVTPITLCSLDIICETTLGVSIGAQKNSKSKYVQSVHRASAEVFQRAFHLTHLVNWSFNLTSTGRQLKKDIEYLHKFTESIISNKKQQLLSNVGSQNRKRRALMDLLLEQHVQNQTLSEKDIREEIDTFTFEGHDTTSMGMTWALYLIGLYKDIQEMVHEEMDAIFGDDFERPVTTEDLNYMEYLERVLKESQRLYPSVPYFGRKLSEDVNLCGTKIPKGSPCFILIYCLHRDATVFPNPEKFDPDRFLPENSINRHPYAYIPFSAGPRNCIGQRFAMMEEKVVIANILRNYTLESLDSRDKVLLAPDLVLRAGVPVRIKLRSRRP